MFISIDPSDDMHEPDFLAFSIIVYLAIKSRQSSAKIPTILGAMAEDATWYFLVIFTSHLVLEITLVFGRVSTAAPLRLHPTTSNTCLSRNRSNLFQLRKSSLTLTTTNHPHRAFCHHHQRQCRVSSTFGSHPPHPNDQQPCQVYSRDDITDNDLVEENGRQTAKRLDPWRIGRHKSPDLEFFPTSKWHEQEGR